MASASKEFIDAVQDEMERQGFSATRQAAKSKADRIMSTLDFLTGGNYREIEAFSSKINDAMSVYKNTAAKVLPMLEEPFEGAKEACNAVEKRIEELRTRAHDIVAPEMVFPDSVEGRILSLQRELMRDLITCNVSPDIAARCASYTLWAYLGGGNEPAFLKQAAEVN